VSYNYNVDGYDDPGPGILNHGLAPLPHGLEFGFGFAVARWVDRDFGVVLVVDRQEGDDPDDEYGYDVHGYIRRNGKWESTNGSGGGNWWNPPFQRPPGLAHLDVVFAHRFEENDPEYGKIRIANGIAGEGVVTVELDHGGTVAQMPVESAMGVWVVGVLGDRPATWRLRDVDGRVVRSGDFDSFRTY
jgi:hypothetical protein